jgi:hypothetical protein
MYTGILPSKKRAPLTPVSQSWFDKWSVKNPILKNLPAIVSKLGPRPDTINDRIMTCLGADKFLQPFSMLGKQVNKAKGDLFGGKNPVAVARVKAAAADFVRTDARKEADVLLSLVRNVSSPVVSFVAWVSATNNRCRDLPSSSICTNLQ